MYFGRKGCVVIEPALMEDVDMDAWVLLLHQHITLLIYQDNIGLFLNSVLYTSDLMEGSPSCNLLSE